MSNEDFIRNHQIPNRVFDKDRNAIRAYLVGGFAIPVEADFIEASYPSNIQEIYVYKSGGAIGLTLKTVTVNYTDASKKNISSVAIS